MEKSFALARPLGLLLLSAAILIACDSDGNLIAGIESLGLDFIRAFNQDPNAVPFDAQDLRLVLTPSIEPFNP